MASPSQPPVSRFDSPSSDPGNSRTADSVNSWSASQPLSAGGGGVIDLDIDGIIQSFLGEQVNSQGILPVSTNETSAQSFPVPNPQSLNYAMPPQSCLDQAGDGYAVARPNWMQPSVDDLLFGFNGSALDDFQGLDWKIP